MTKKYNLKELLEATGINYSTLNTYIGRFEFSHIEKTREGRKLIFKNVSQDDIKKLKDLKDNRRPLVDNQMEIINHYGYKNQLLKLVEELRELEQVIIYAPENEEHLKEEMADVLNLIEQIIKFRNWHKSVEKEKTYKINRQIIRMQNEFSRTNRKS